MYVHLKSKPFKNLDEMAREADLFAEARGGVFSCVNKRQRDTTLCKPESKPSGKPEIKCGLCGKGHIAIRRYNNPDRKQIYSAEIGANASGSSSDSMIKKGVCYFLKSSLPTAESTLKCRKVEVLGF